MQETNKLPLKRVELSLTKFNEVAIPHHLDLLRQHKANINKYEENGDYSRVRTEQSHARRVAAQLRSLLGELDSLRRQVRDEDCDKFDKMTKRSRDLTLRAIMEYLKPSTTRSTAVVPGSVTSTDSVGVLPQLQIQLEVDEQELELRAREEALRGWAELQEELQALHQMWGQLHEASVVQREQVSSVAENVETADENVQVARTTLSYAERLRAGAFGVGGAAVGAALGGPLGLVLGGKVAAIAALTGSLAGYIGGKMIGQRRQLQLEQEENEQKATKEAIEQKSKDD